MTDLSLTAATVVPGTNANIVYGTSGETIVAGKSVYKASATNKWMLLDCDAATAEARGSDENNTGIALNGASLNQPLAVCTSGPVTIGGSMTPGAGYYAGDDPGSICPIADLATGDYVTQLGNAESASIINVDPKYTGVLT